MNIDGYTEHASKEPSGVLKVYLSAAVVDYLRSEGQPGTRNRKHVMKVDIILKNIRRNGLRGMNNTEQFVHEGKFASGRRAGGVQSVYAVKSDQVRLYGGIVTVGNSSLFLCVEAVSKQRDKANPAQLKRVAVSLGEKYDQLG